MNKLEKKSKIAIIIVAAVVGFLMFCVIGITAVILVLKGGSSTDEGKVANTDNDNVFKYEYDIKAEPKPEEESIIDAYLFKENEKFGLINSKGDTIVEPKFNKLEQFKEGVAAAQIYSDKVGFINEKGDFVIELDEETSFIELGYNYGVAIVVNKDGSFQLINKDGEKISAKFKRIEYIDYGIFSAEDTEGKISLLDKNIEGVELPKGASNPKAFSENFVEVNTKSGKEVVSLKTSKILDIKYTEIHLANNEFIVIDVDDNSFANNIKNKKNYNLFDSNLEEVKLKDGYTIENTSFRSDKSVEPILLLEDNDNNQIVTSISGEIKYTKKMRFEDSNDIEINGKYLRVSDNEYKVVDFQGNIIADNLESMPYEIGDDYILFNKDSCGILKDHNGEEIFKGEKDWRLKPIGNFIMVEKPGTSGVSIYSKSGEEILKPVTEKNQIVKVGNMILSIDDGYYENVKSGRYINEEGRVIEFN